MKKPFVIQLLTTLTYWTILLLAILGNFLLTVAITPMIVVLPDTYAVIAMALIGIAFGSLIDNLLQNAGQCTGQKVIAEVFIPVIGLITTHILITLSNSLAVSLKLPTREPLLISAVYVLAFSIPHVVFKVRKYLFSSKTVHTC